MSNNADIQRISFEEIQELKDLDLYDLTWTQTGGRQVYLAYDAASSTFSWTYGTVGSPIPMSNANMYYGYQEQVNNFINNPPQDRPSYIGISSGSGLIASADLGSVKKFDVYEAVIGDETYPGSGIYSPDEYVYVGNIDPRNNDLQGVTDRGNETTNDILAPNLVRNDSDTYPSNEKISFNITLSQAEYDAIGEGNYDASTVYFII